MIIYIHNVDMSICCVIHIPLDSLEIDFLSNCVAGRDTGRGTRAKEAQGCASPRFFGCMAQDVSLNQP